MFGDDDLLSESSNASEKQARPVRQPDEESVDIGNTTVSPEPEISFSARLHIGCTLSRIREETRLNALEATERMIANNTRYRFRVSEERVQRFSVGDTVIFKDPEGVPAKEKQNAKDPFKPRNVVGIVKERRALNFYRVEWKKNGKCQVSTLYAGMLSKRKELAACQTGPNRR